MAPYPSRSRRRRHIFSDGTILYKRPSLITGVFGTGSGYGFHWYFDGNKMTRTYNIREDADYERQRLVAFAGGEVVPPEVRL